MQNNGSDKVKPRRSVVKGVQKAEHIPGLTFNGHPVRKDKLGSVYTFFLLHLGVFGISGFYMAYFAGNIPLPLLYMHGGIATFIYILFYIAIFGRDKVKWMFINAGLGAVGIYAQIGWLLERFGRSIGDYSIAVHIVPFIYFILYTFLIRQIFIDVTGAREHKKRLAIANTAYVVSLLLVSVGAQLSKTLL